jgi:hypothetical protein
MLIPVLKKTQQFVNYMTKLSSSSITTPYVTTAALEEHLPSYVRSIDNIFYEPPVIAK